MLKLPENERIAYERYQEDLRYQASMVESSYTIGMMKGEEKGIEKGIEKGGKNKAMEIAKNLIGLLDTETIAAKTGLTEGEIMALRQES